MDNFIVYNINLTNLYLVKKVNLTRRNKIHKYYIYLYFCKKKHVWGFNPSYKIVNKWKLIIYFFLN